MKHSGVLGECWFLSPRGDVPAVVGWCPRAPRQHPAARAVGRGQHQFPFPAPAPGQGNPSKCLGLRLPSPHRRRAPGWPGAAALALLPQPHSPHFHLPEPKATPRGCRHPGVCTSGSPLRGILSQVQTWGGSGCGMAGVGERSVCR